MILPTTIIGPVLLPTLSASVEAIRRMLAGKMLGIPRLGFPFVDVRDVGDLQILAMTEPKAAAQRILGGGSFIWLADAAGILRTSLGDAAAKVPKRPIPSLLVRLISLRDRGLRSVVRELDQERTVSSEKARQLLGWCAPPVEQSLIDCARSLIALGLAP